MLKLQIFMKIFMKYSGKLIEALLQSMHFCIVKELCQNWKVNNEKNCCKKKTMFSQKTTKNLTLIHIFTLVSSFLFFVDALIKTFPYL